MNIRQICELILSNIW